MKRAPRWLLLLLVPITLGFGLFTFDLPRTLSDDMAPTLRKGDLLLACRICGAPDRGDVVMFADPEHAGELSIRRIVAAPGDRVEVHRGQVRVNGIPLVDTPAGKRKLPGLDNDLGQHALDFVEEKVGGHVFEVIRDDGITATGDRPPEMLTDSYFLLADRRTLARDSRDYGPVRERDVRSRVLRVLHAGDGDGARQRPIP